MKDNFYETNRTYECAFTKEKYKLFRNPSEGSFSLKKTLENATYNYPVGTEVNGFEIRAYDVIYKFKDGTQKLVKKGQFLHLNLDNPYTHYKIPNYHKRFVKV